MIIPLIDRFAVSAVKSEDGRTSLHLCHTYQDNLEYCPAYAYYTIDPQNRGTWLEHTSLEEFPLDNPLVTNDPYQVATFIREASKWAHKKLQESAQLSAKPSVG